MTEQEMLYILAIAEERNITHAAERLHVAQPSLTQSLRKIETELGTKLFTRRKYGLDPTDTGKLYIEMARDVTARISTFREDLRKMNDPMMGHLTLGASWYNTLLYFSDFVPKFSRTYPDAQLRLVEKNTAGLMEMLKGHEIDVIIAHEYPKEYPGQQPALAKDICREVLETESFLVLGQRQIFLENGIPENETADLQKLKDLPFILFNDNQRIRRITDFAFRNAGISVKSALFTQSFPGALDFAAMGLGLVVLPEHYIAGNISRYPSLVSVPLDPSLHAYWTNCVYYRVQEYSDPLRKEALRILKESVHR